MRKGELLRHLVASERECRDRRHDTCMTVVYQEARICLGGDQSHDSISRVPSLLMITEQDCLDMHCLI
jgi:hypothetical protein